MVAPVRTIASRRGGLGLAPLLDRVAALPGDDGEVQRRAGGIHMRNVAQHQRRCAGFGQRGGQRFGDGGFQRGNVGPVGGGLEGLAQRAAASSESRRYGAPNRPCSQARAGASPSDVPPWAAISARVSACLLSACASVPSNTVIARQPPVMLLLADGLGGGQVDAGLGLVGEPDDGRAGAGLGDGAQCGGAGGEVGERPRLVAGGLPAPGGPAPAPG